MNVLESMQSLINSWGSLVQVTGGCIEINKSWWYLVDFVWHRGSWVTMDPLEGADLQATTADGSQVSLRRLCHHEAAEMLGLWTAPSGSRKKLLNVLKTKAIA